MADDSVLYKVQLQVDGGSTVIWPQKVPAPAVGDVITYEDGKTAEVHSRVWDVQELQGLSMYVLIVMARSRSPVKPGRASVEPLRI